MDYVPYSSLRKAMIDAVFLNKQPGFSPKRVVTCLDPEMPNYDSARYMLFEILHSYSDVTEASPIVINWCFTPPREKDIPFRVLSVVFSEKHGLPSTEGLLSAPADLALIQDGRSTDFEFFSRPMRAMMATDAVLAVGVPGALLHQERVRPSFAAMKPGYSFGGKLRPLTEKGLAFNDFAFYFRDGDRQKARTQQW